MHSGLLRAFRVGIATTSMVYPEGFRVSSNLRNYRNEQVSMFLELYAPVVPQIMRIIEIGAALGIMGIMGIMGFWGS